MGTILNLDSYLLINLGLHDEPKFAKQALRMEALQHAALERNSARIRASGTRNSESVVCLGGTVLGTKLHSSTFTGGCKFLQYVAADVSAFCCRVLVKLGQVAKHENHHSGFKLKPAYPAAVSTLNGAPTASCQNVFVWTWHGP